MAIQQGPFLNKGKGLSHNISQWPHWNLPRPQHCVLFPINIREYSLIEMGWADWAQERGRIRWHWFVGLPGQWWNIPSVGRNRWMGSQAAGVCLRGQWCTGYGWENNHPAVLQVFPGLSVGKAQWSYECCKVWPTCPPSQKWSHSGSREGIRHRQKGDTWCWEWHFRITWVQVPGGSQTPLLALVIPQVKLRIDPLQLPKFNLGNPEQPEILRGMQQCAPVLLYCWAEC